MEEVLLKVLKPENIANNAFIYGMIFASYVFYKFLWERRTKRNGGRTDKIAESIKAMAGVMSKIADVVSIKNEITDLSTKIGEMHTIILGRTGKPKEGMVFEVAQLQDDVRDLKKS